MKNIFVGNLSYQTTENELRTAFETFGEVLNVKAVIDRDTGRARGFAFVEMANPDEADRAIAEMNGKELDGRQLTVNEARPKGDRSPSPRGNRGGFRQKEGNPFRRRERW